MNLYASAGLLGCLLLAQSGLAAPGDPPAGTSDDAVNPYAVISDRNVFHLNPIPPPPPVDQPKADLPVIKLSGFFVVGHKVRALFCALPSKHGKEGAAYYNLAEGEKSNILEVVKIRYHEGAVDIINSGTPMTLSLKEDGLAATDQPPAKTAASPASPAGLPARHLGGPSQQPGGFPARPAAATGFPPGPAANGSDPFPARPRRIPLSDKTGSS
jgi:hypothetical protein